jgi:hypothetical protein
MKEEFNTCDMLEVYWAYCAIKSDVRIGQQLPFYDHRKRGVPSRRIDIRARQDLILFIGDLAQKREWGRSDIRNIHDIRMQPMNRINTGRAVIQRRAQTYLESARIIPCATRSTNSYWTFPVVSRSKKVCGVGYICCSPWIPMAISLGNGKENGQV